MVQVIQEFGVIGLGRMGGGLAMQALGKNMVVAGFELRGASASRLSCARNLWITLALVRVYWRRKAAGRGFVGRSAREAARRAVKIVSVGRGPGCWTARAVQVRDEDGRKGAFLPPGR